MTEPTEPTRPATPELDRQSAVIDMANTAANFYDWVTSQGFTLCQHQEPGPENGHTGGFYPAHIPPQQLLASWLNIDLGKIEAERQALLKYLAAQR